MRPQDGITPIVPAEKMIHFFSLKVHCSLLKLVAKPEAGQSEIKVFLSRNAVCV